MKTDKKEAKIMSKAARVVEALGVSSIAGRHGDLALRHSFTDSVSGLSVMSTLHGIEDSFARQESRSLTIYADGQTVFSRDSLRPAATSYSPGAWEKGLDVLHRTAKQNRRRAHAPGL